MQTGGLIAYSERRAWAGLAVLALPTLLVSMDMTVVYLAVPALSEALRPDSVQLLWITDIYGFMEAGLLITMGILGDRIGRRKLLMAGAVAFAAASALAAFSVSAAMLIGARALMGIAGATLLPSTLSLIRNLFHDEARRTKALGVWTMCFSAGTMLGPLAGGFLLHHYWWGSIFLMGVPAMLLFRLSGPVVLPESKDPGKGRFDLVSVGLALVATLPFIWGVKRWAAFGWGWPAAVCVAAGVGFAAVFLRRQRRLEDPLIDLRLFRIPAFRAAQYAMFLCLFTWVGISFYFAQQLQLVMGMNPLLAGLWTIPGAASSAAGCLLAPVLVRRWPRAVVLPAGMGLLCGGTLLMSMVAGRESLLWLELAMLLLCLGCAISVTLCHDVVLTAAPPQRAGAAAGITETSAAYGGSFGVGLLGSIGAMIYQHRMAAVVAGLPSAANAAAAAGTLGGAVAVAVKLPAARAAGMLETANQAFGLSFQWSAIFCVVVLALAIVPVAGDLRRGGMMAGEDDAS